MTNADQPQDITTRLDDIDDRLEQLGDELDLIRTVQNANSVKRTAITFIHRNDGYAYRFTPINTELLQDLAI